MTTQPDDGCWNSGYAASREFRGGITSQRRAILQLVPQRAFLSVHLRWLFGALCKRLRGCLTKPKNDDCGTRVRRSTAMRRHPDLGRKNDDKLS